MLTDALSWLLNRVDEARETTPKDKRVPPSNHILEHLGTSWTINGNYPNTKCRCMLKLSDASVVHSNGGGAWVCDACMGKWEGRFTFACKKCDFDVCPKCFAALSQSSTEQTYFRTLKQVIGFAARLLDPALLSDAKTATPEFMGITKKLRTACADAIGPVWCPDGIARLDHENIKAVLRLVTNLVVAEHAAHRVVAAPPVPNLVHDDSMRRILTRTSIGQSIGEMLSFGAGSARRPGEGRQPRFGARPHEGGIFASAISDDAAMPPPGPRNVGVVADPDSIQILIDMVRRSGRHPCSRPCEGCGGGRVRLIVHVEPLSLSLMHFLSSAN